MVNNYYKFFHHTRYSFKDIKKQVFEVKKCCSNVVCTYKKPSFTLFLDVKPTENSVTYKIKMITRVNSSKVNIYVIEPRIMISQKQGIKVPHMYSDSSLCLYYPRYREWEITDSWVKTLIPWVSLWLYYYEVWEMTGKWYGGGIHPK